MALHAAHRESVDFDFFSSLPLGRAAKRALRRGLGLQRAPVTQEDENTLGVQMDTDAGPVLLSFFGGLPHPRLEPPLAAADGPRVASRLDLAGFKAAMTYQRHEENDAADLAALLAVGETLPRALAAMQAFYPEPELLPRVVAALTWFDQRTPSPQGAHICVPVSLPSRPVPAFLPPPVCPRMPEAQRVEPDPPLEPSA